MNDFVKNALEELKQIQQDETFESDELRKLITESKTRTSTFVIGDTEIKIKSSIPRNLKQLMIKVERASHDDLSIEDKISLGNYFAYTFLSGICIDKPYTSLSFWQKYDDEIGDAQRVATEIVERLSSTEEKIIKFR